MKSVATSSAFGVLTLSWRTPRVPFCVSSAVSALKFWFTPTTLNWNHSFVWCCAPRSLAIDVPSVFALPVVLTHAFVKAPKVSPM